MFYIINKALIPVISGNVILYFMNFPNNPVELLLYYSTVILIVVPMFSNYNSLQNAGVRSVRLTNRPRFAWLYLVVMIVIVVLFRIVFEDGMSYV